MIEIKRSFFGSILWVFANHVFASAPKIPCGERVVERFPIISG
jgi:hypothetical protein